MCWLTVGTLLGEPGGKLVHVLISLLSNQVENESGVPGWLGERGKRFPCFLSWGIFVSKKNIHVFCTCILLHNHNLNLVVCCRILLHNHNFSSVVCCRIGCVLCIGRG